MLVITAGREGEISMKNWGAGVGAGVTPDIPSPPSPDFPHFPSRNTGVNGSHDTLP